MSKADDIRAFIKANPGKNTAEIAHAVNWTTGRVSAMLWTELRKTKRVIRREVERLTISGTPVYRYYYDGTIPPQKKVKVEAPATLTKVPAVLTEKHVVSPEVRAHLTEKQIRELHAPTPRDDSLDALADVLARAFADHVARRFAPHLTQALRNILPDGPVAPAISVEQLTASLSGPSEQRTRLTSVLIAGLRPNQAGMISAEFGEVFNLKFYQMDDSLGQLRKMLGTLGDVDHVITFTSHISHKVTEVVKASGFKVNHCTGGMSMLKDMLVKLYAEGEL